VPHQPNSSGSTSTDGRIPEAELCLQLTLAPFVAAEFNRHLGYPAAAAPAERMNDRIARIVAEAHAALQPRGSFAIYPVADQTAHSLTLGQTAISGAIGDYLAHARRVAVFVVTLGEEISRRAEAAAKSGDAFSAWVIDAFGSWAAEAAADALMLCLGEHLGEGEALTLRYSPGYCGMEIAQQRALFSLVQAGPLGVTLMPSMLMHPLKSISGLVGLAPRASVADHRSPCELCPRFGCSMRR
jgi:cobalamin-dependent methionine synthase I